MKMGLGGVLALALTAWAGAANAQPRAHILTERSVAEMAVRTHPSISAARHEAEVAPARVWRHAERIAAELGVRAPALHVVDGSFAAFTYGVRKTVQGRRDAEAVRASRRRHRASRRNRRGGAE